VAEADPIDLQTGVGRAAAVNRKRRVLKIVRAADVLEAAASGLGRLDARNQHDFIDVAAAGGNGLDELLRKHAFLLRALHVDDRALAADRDGFRYVAEAQIRVDRRDKRALEDKAFALVGVKSGQRERHGV